MSSLKNGVDRVCLSYFYKSKKTSVHTVWPVKIKTVAVLYLTILQTFVVAFTMLWAYLVKKRSRSVRNIFKKSAKSEVKTFRPTKIEKRPILYNA